MDGAAQFVRDLLAAGKAESTVRSYGTDLLRWFRFCWVVRVDWDRATRTEARNFSRWLQVAGSSPVLTGGRGRWQQGRPAPPAARRTLRLSGRTRRRCCGRSTASTSTRAPGRSSTRSRWTGRGGTGGRTRITIRWSRTGTSAAASIGRKCPAGCPAASRTGSSTRSSPGCGRTGIQGARRVLRVYRRPGLGTAVGDRRRDRSRPAGDHGGRSARAPAELQGVARLGGRLRVAAALPGRDGGTGPEGAAAALVVDSAAAGPAAVLSRRPPDVRAGERAGRDLCHAAFLEAHRGLQDGGGFLASADRRPVCPWSCPVDHHADLPDASQGGGDPAGCWPIMPSRPGRRLRGAVRPRRKGYRPETLDVLFRNGAS